MKRWINKHWAKLAMVASSFLAGVAGGEAIDWSHLVVSIVNAVL